MAIEFYDFNDFIDYIAQIFDKNITNNNIEQENGINSEFKFFCTVNIVTLKGNFKEKADHIIEMISDMDEYTWMYIIFKLK